MSTFKQIYNTAKSVKGSTQDQEDHREIVKTHVKENMDSIMKIKKDLDKHLKSVKSINKTTSKIKPSGNVNEDENTQNTNMQKDIDNDSAMFIQHSLEKIEKINMDYRHYKVLSNDDSVISTQTADNVKKNNSNAFTQLVKESKDIVKKINTSLKKTVTDINVENVKNRWKTYGPDEGLSNLLRYSEQIHDDFDVVDALKAKKYGAVNNMNKEQKENDTSDNLESNPTSMPKYIRTHKENEIPVAVPISPNRQNKETKETKQNTSIKKILKTQNGFNQGSPLNQQNLLNKPRKLKNPSNNNFNLSEATAGLGSLASKLF
jgi:hypothetical protein